MTRATSLPTMKEMVRYFEADLRNAAREYQQIATVNGQERVSTWTEACTRWRKCTKVSLRALWSEITSPLHLHVTAYGVQGCGQGRKHTESPERYYGPATTCMTTTLNSIGPRCSARYLITVQYILQYDLSHILNISPLYACTCLHRDRKMAAILIIYQHLTSGMRILMREALFVHIMYP